MDPEDPTGVTAPDEKMSSSPVVSAKHNHPPSSSSAEGASAAVAADELEEEKLDSVQMQHHKPLGKAKPMSKKIVNSAQISTGHLVERNVLYPAGDPKENKFTSTLRRLSTVRKNKKAKRKEVDRNLMEREFVSEEDYEPGGAAAAAGGIPGMGTVGSSNGGFSSARPASTTSRESEGEVVTSGYFR